MDRETQGIGVWSTANPCRMYREVYQDYASFFCFLSQLKIFASFVGQTLRMLKAIGVWVGNEHKAQ